MVVKKLLYGLFYIKHLVKHLRKAYIEELGDLNLDDLDEWSIKILEDDIKDKLTFEDYMMEIELASEFEEGELLGKIYRDENLTRDEKFELDCYLDCKC